MVTAQYPMGNIWLKDMKHVFLFNQGKPFHVHSHLFHATSVTQTNTPTELPDFATFYMSPTLFPKLDILHAWDSLYQQVIDNAT